MRQISNARNLSVLWLAEVERRLLSPLLPNVKCLHKPWCVVKTSFPGSFCQWRHCHSQALLFIHVIIQITSFPQQKKQTKIKKNKKTENELLTILIISIIDRVNTLTSVIKCNLSTAVSLNELQWALYFSVYIDMVFYFFFFFLVNGLMSVPWK